MTDTPMKRAIEALKGELGATQTSREGMLLVEDMFSDQRFGECVRAVLRAVRVPSMDMRDVGNEIYEKGVLFAEDGNETEIWQAMIDAALEEHISPPPKDPSEVHFPESWADRR